MLKKFLIHIIIYGYRIRSHFFGKLGVLSAAVTAVPIAKSFVKGQRSLSKLGSVYGEVMIREILTISIFLKIPILLMTLHKLDVECGNMDG